MSLDMSKLRQLWIDKEYDAIMTNGAGNFVYNVLKSNARNMTEGDLVESLLDSLEIDEAALAVLASKEVAA